MDERENHLTTRILGLEFTNLSCKEVYRELASNGGLLTVPSGPGLAEIPKDEVYYSSLKNSDLIIADSGYMVLTWNIWQKRSKVRHLSGVEFIEHFLREFPGLKQGTHVFLVNPTPEEDHSNRALLASLNSEVSLGSYIAPFYSKEGVIKDEELLHILESQKPEWVLLNIAGGKQEKLGSWLKDRLSYRPAILCTGAAIAFFTGNQVKLPVWVVNLYLGWLVRIISSPSRYFKRYYDAVKLLPLLLRYGGNAVEPST